MGGRKRPSVAVSDDESEQSDHSSASSASKRARHDGDASSTTAHTQDAFQRGSLVRVKLTNFVTYTAAEFHLGPSLNMVIGPNGTGKSTLVCAICLGLGWGSENLGRAKDVGEFVKHGASVATIEIELAEGPGGGPNHIITRTIRKEDNQSRWFLDGERSKQRDIVHLAKQYSIQIDNLCQFLPQDRVVEFAKMSDVDRLRETQRAAAPPHMVEWHDALKDLRQEERKLETKRQNEGKHLEALKKVQTAAQADVDRIRERQEITTKSNCLRKARPVIELRLCRKEIDQLRDSLRIAKLELDEIKVDVAPARQAQSEMESYRSDIEQVVSLRKNRVDQIKKKADSLMAAIEADRDRADEFESDIKTEVITMKERKKDIARIRTEINTLEQRRQQEPEPYHADSYEKRKTDIRAQISARSNEILEKEEARKSLRARNLDLQAQQSVLKTRQEELSTRSGKQANMLQQLSHETATAWAWIQKNKDLIGLKGEVYGPPILECSVPDARYARAVEGQLRKGDVIAITCTNSDDQGLLTSRLLNKQENGGLGLNDVYLRTSPKSLDSYKSPIPQSDLSNYGFQGYIRQYIQGPDAVLAMLCDNKNLHQIAYAATPISEERHNAVSNSSLRTWVSGVETYRVTTRREYNQSSTSVVKLGQAKWFIDLPANTDEMRILAEQENKLGEERGELRKKHECIGEEIKVLQEERNALNKDMVDVQAEQDAIKSDRAEWAALPEKIASRQTQLDNYTEQVAQTSNRIRAIKAKIRTTSLRVATQTLEYAKTVTHMRIFNESLIEAQIRLIEAKSEISALERENSALLQRQATKEGEIEALETRKEKLREVFRARREVTQQDINSWPVNEREIIARYTTELQSLEELEQEVMAVEAQLSMMAEGNHGVIETYEKRKEEIARTEAKLDQLSADLEDVKQRIIEIRQKWEPELDALIRKISSAFAHNFKQIGCAGEVEVYKDQEDFDLWSIQISVRFRENEPLSILNSHRQSGGERAVSTIFYLMALQDLAQSPFRVVDEINQGMDPRNERMVHERMVDIACQERTSQYFLITPKLLTGLKFHPKMKVHIINSGEHVPDSSTLQGDWNLSTMAKDALKARKGIEVS
ncbi:structural maintenance of chromosomes 5 smc5 [Pyrenophora seminiperda CCB06]|uniref:Structural maintenance of chromosomes protein 5 n=1 Tax=Pyrenophora seminiperda CCB06 TaxID=1302712 RepID=A0A3M7M950_9PLEO|nr:structural maintenance of chromosomes 5 smc5 [Pyrenophora seminiperda CCB06]